MKTGLILSMTTLLATAFCAAQEPAAPAEGITLTVYSAADPAEFDPKASLDGNGYGYTAMPGYGVVRDVRKVNVQPGEALRIKGIAAGIDPTTVQFRSFTDPKTTVLEQDFEYDLVSSSKLLDKYIDRKVVVERTLEGGKLETIEGTLLSASYGLILKDDAGAVRIINSYTGVRLADAANLITKPTLVWELATDQPGEQLAEVSYQTEGITWRADYSMVLNKDEEAAALSSWVTLLNQSGASYPNATLKLVAGDVQRTNPRQFGDGRHRVGYGGGLFGGEGGFEEKSFFEYHLYTLGRTTSIDDNSTKQIELFPPRKDVPLQKVYVYFGLALDNNDRPHDTPWGDRELGMKMNKKVDVYVRLTNDKESGMGMPLPAGRVRVYKRDDADGNAEFIGEDVIQHTPRNEPVLIRLGSAFDLVGERKQTNFEADWGVHITESFEIKLRNRKEEPVTILVKESLFRWVNWEITQSSHKWEKQDSRTIHFPIDLKPGEEKTLTYTVKYTW